MSLENAPIQVVRIQKLLVLAITDQLFSDGAGLATGVLQKMARQGSRRPKVLAATHFHEIFEAGYLIDEPTITFGHMEVRINPDVRDVEHQIIYLYKYDRGEKPWALG